MSAESHCWNIIEAMQRTPHFSPAQVTLYCLYDQPPCLFPPRNDHHTRSGHRHTFLLFSCQSERNQLERTHCLLLCAESSLQLMLMKLNCQKHNMQQLVYESWDPIQFMGKPELVVSLWFSEFVYFVFRIFCFALFPGKHQKLLQNCRRTKTIWKH